MNTTMESKRAIAEARALLAKASARPWVRYLDYITAPNVPLERWENPEHYKGQHLICESIGMSANTADGELIAAAPGIIENLCRLLGAYVDE